MAYQHVDTECLQTPKRAGEPCGDASWVYRTPWHTTFLLADGIGSGVRAHIAALMNGSRVQGLLRDGATLRDAFTSLAGTMSKWRDHTLPFSAFLLERIVNGNATILNYEMPPPLRITARGAEVLRGEPLDVPTGLASAHHCPIGMGEGLMVFSDGIAQAGMGRALEQGWTVDNVERFLNHWQRRGQPLPQLARQVMRQAEDYDGHLPGDDKTVLIATTRKARVVHVFSGPPQKAEDDERVAHALLEADATKVICGATTAEIVSRAAGIPIDVEQYPEDWTTPPRCYMDGIDLVTEGAITLNQVYRLLEEDLAGADDHSAAADLARLFKSADWVRFTVGEAQNPAHKDLTFRKQGILVRGRIIPMIGEKLERMGKLFTMERV